MSSKMNYPAQLELYNLDDVYVTSLDINFAMFNFSACQHSLPGYWDSEKFDAGRINRTFYIKALMSLDN